MKIVGRNCWNLHGLRLNNQKEGTYARKRAGKTIEQTRMKRRKFERKSLVKCDGDVMSKNKTVTRQTLLPEKVRLPPKITKGCKRTSSVHTTLVVWQKCAMPLTLWDDEHFYHSPKLWSDHHYNCRGKSGLQVGVVRLRKMVYVQPVIWHRYVHRVSILARVV